MSRSVLFFALLLIFAAGTAAAETVAGLPLHIENFDSGAIRVWIGDHISSSATIAVPTRDGLVIIDSTGNPKVDRELRRIIAREFGRDDFKYLINTHEHWDHTGGNSVYDDCIIVGHELVAEGMARNVENRQRNIDWLTNRIVELEEEIKQAAADLPELPRLKEELILDRLNLAAKQENAPPVPPTKTFADRMELNLGDTTFELSYIGGMHTASDIAIFIPEHGMLLTGDTMADVWLTDTPGCLASFIARPGIKHDFPLLLTNWNALLDRKDEIKYLVPSHWNGELTMAGFENRVKYVEALWNGTNLAQDSGASLRSMFTTYNLAEKFPDLVNSPGCSQGNNSTTIIEMWTTATDQESAAVAIYDLMDDGADAADIQKIAAQHDADDQSYFFLEAEFNSYGYRFFQAEKLAEATAMFKLNTELYPDSWNTFDSLGEALFASGENEAAIAMYEKSLELNPESPSGTQMLERIRAGSAVN